jgi:ribonuclease HI
LDWIEATFTNRSGKRQNVWVQVDDDGELAITDGRVPMRYSIDEGSKTYSASPKNLALDGEEPAQRKRRKKSGKKKKSKTKFDEDVWKQPDGRRVTGHEVPDDLSELDLPPDDVIDCWTDGACTGNPGPCGFGVVIREGDDYREISQYLGIGTNNIAELYAIYVALAEARNIDGQLRIHTDSNYSIGVLTKGWKAKANTELVESIREMIAQFEPRPKFVKVKGHAGIPLNERADWLAVSAVERKK